MNKKSISQVSPTMFNNKRVFVRVDFNVPQNEDLTISDDTRIKAALPTIKFLVDAGAKVILASHLGRPKGHTEKYSLKPVALRLSELLGKQVLFLPNCVGDTVEKAVQEMQKGQVCLLENVRFHHEEEKNDPEFAKKLAKLADIYVNDAFGSAHRAHASVEGICRHVKPALAGLLMEKELIALGQALNNPKRPFATVIGGAKVSSKIGVLKNLIDRADILVVGGAMAFTFLKAQGKNVGKSLVEDDRLELCRELLKKAEAKKVKLVLPCDVVCASEIKEGAKASVHSVDDIPSDQMGLDIGPKTIKLFNETLSQAKTIVWNGPLGVFETPGFEKGTYALIDTLIQLTQSGTKTIVGGGDSVAALELRSIQPTLFSHVSTGGGASLEFLEGLELPGVACLDQATVTTSAV